MKILKRIIAVTIILLLVFTTGYCIYTGVRLNA